MPSGSAVIVYKGKRGRVFRIKYRDSDRVQVQETLGREDDGWNHKKAEKELHRREVDVEREGMRRGAPITFASFANEWRDTYPDAKGLKRSTTSSYKTIIDNHLVPAFGHLKLEAIDVRKLEAYVAAKRKAGFQPRTVNRQLNLLHQLLESARKQQIVRFNAVEQVDRPREPRRRWTILGPAELGRVERAFAELAGDAVGIERRWLEQARVVFLLVVEAGLRRGEVLGLRWRAVDLADPSGPRLRVDETVVWGATDTPKSEAGERTIAIGERLADELFQHRGRSSFQGDDEYVFGHPEKGTVLDHKSYGKTLKAALAKAKIEKPMRPFHDGRHTSITNAATAMSPAALMSRAGHSDFKTTQLYIDLSGETFRDEADQLAERLWGKSPTKLRRSA